MHHFKECVVCDSFMKVMDRPSALQDAPCLCQETGRQVTLLYLTHRVKTYSMCTQTCYGVCVCVLGHVGPPLPCNYIKLIDVAEMSYYADNGEGEVSRRDVLLLCKRSCDHYIWC